MSPPLKAMLLIVFAVAVSAGIAMMNRSKAVELVPWRTDPIAALADAKAAGTPTLLYFTADWCGPCQWMKENTWSDPSVAKALEGYVPVKIDVDRQEDLARAYQIRGIPRMIVVNADGKPQRDIVGGMNPGEFVAWLNR